jgi:hypothetical protein
VVLSLKGLRSSYLQRVRSNILIKFEQSSANMQLIASWVVCLSFHETLGQDRNSFTGIRASVSRKRRGMHVVLPSIL